MDFENNVLNNTTTIFLVKKENNKIHHFRVTPKEYGISVIEGQFYNYIKQWYKGYGNFENAKKEAQKLIEEKLNDGYIIEVFYETKENTLIVYDKAKWHFNGNFPSDLDSYQGYVHLGFYVGWLIDNNLMSIKFNENNAAEINIFKKREITGGQLIKNCIDGTLLVNDISEVGNKFSLDYYESEQYYHDYYETLGTGLLTMYHVKDNWENYNKMAKVISKRFNDWKENLKSENQ